MLEKVQLVNTSWQLFDKVIKLILGFFVNIAVARYLGPDEYGYFSIFITFNMFLMLFVNLGMDKIALANFSLNKDNQLVFSGYFILSLLGAILSTTITLLVAVIIGIGLKGTLVLSAVTLGNIFQPFSVVDLYYQGKSNSQPVVLIRIISFVFCNILKIVALSLKLPLLAFAIIFSLEVIISSLGFVVLAWKGNLSFFGGGHWLTAKRLLCESLPLFLMGVVTLLYMRIDQLIIGALLNTRSLGLYGAAVRLSELWYFVPVTLANAYFPYFMRLFNEDKEKFSKVLVGYISLINYGSILVSVATVLFCRQIIGMTYGFEYATAQNALVYNIWALVFVGQGVSVNVYYIANRLQAKSLVIAAFSCVFSISMNIVFLPRFGFIAAAVTMLVTQGLFTLVVPLIIPDMRKPTLIMWRSFDPRNIGIVWSKK